MKTRTMKHTWENSINTTARMVIKSIGLKADSTKFTLEGHLDHHHSTPVIFNQRLEY